MTKALRVMIVDDQRLFASSLRKVLEAEAPAVESVVIASDGEDAIRRIPETLPDVVLMDAHMPKIDGIEATRRIHSEFPDIAILMLSAFGYEEYVREAMTVGARGYLLKDISPEELVASISNAAAGTVVFSPQVVPSISGFPQTPLIDRQTAKSRTRLASVDWLWDLTPRERVILYYISKGFSNNDIAERINVGSQTVRNYVSEIYSKIGARDRFEAMRMAIEANIAAIVAPDVP